MLTACHGAIDPAELFDAGPLVADGGGRRHLDRWLGRVATKPDGHGPHGGGHDDGIRALSLSTQEPIEMFRFIRGVERLLEKHGDRVLRLKGLLNVAGDDRPVVVHGVQHVFHPLARLAAWPDSDRRSRLVLIVRDLDVEKILPEFQNFSWRNGAD